MLINKTVIKRCAEYSISLDELTYLYDLCTHSGWEVEVSSTSISRLMMLGYIADPRTITPKGEEILGRVLSLKKTEESIYSELFEHFWKNYPRTDRYLSHPFTRKVRLQDKKTVWGEYRDALARGFEEEEIVNGLLGHISYMKNVESPTNNPFKFMKSPVNWLKTNEFLKYSDMDEIIPRPSNSASYGKKIY